MLESHLQIPGATRGFNCLPTQGGLFVHSGRMTEEPNRSQAPWERAALEGSAARLVLAVLFVIGGVFSVRMARFVTPSTLWSAHLAHLFSSHPLDVLLLPGASPLSALVYAPLASWGYVGLGHAHVALGALAIVLLARVVKARATAPANLAALSMASSPAFFAASVAGLAGADEAFLVVAALYLWDVAARPGLAAVLLGLLFLVRPEMIVLGVGIALARADRRALAITLAVPAVYLVFGAAMTVDASWIADMLTTPSLAGTEEVAGLRGAVADGALALVAAVPLIAFAGFASDAGTSPERGDLFAAIAFAGAVLVSGALDVGSVGLLPERLVPALPLVCPLLARALHRAMRGEGDASALVVLLGMLVLAELAADLGGGLWALGVVGGAALVVTVARLAPRAALPFAFVALGAGLVLLLPAARLDNDAEVRRLRHVDKRIEERSPPQVITDAPLLGPIVREEAPQLSFLWTGRASAPLRLERRGVDTLGWVLEAHPFGAPLFALDPESLAADTLVIVSEENDRPLSRSPVMARIEDYPTPIYRRLGEAP